MCKQLTWSQSGVGAGERRTPQAFHAGLQNMGAVGSSAVVHHGRLTMRNPLI